MLCVKIKLEDNNPNRDICIFIHNAFTLALLKALMLNSLLVNEYFLTRPQAQSPASQSKSTTIADKF